MNYLCRSHGGSQETTKQGVEHHNSIVINRRKAPLLGLGGRQSTMRHDIPKEGENSPGMELMRLAQKPGNEIGLSISKGQKIRQRLLLIHRGRQPLLQIGWHLLTIWPGGRKRGGVVVQAGKAALPKPCLVCPSQITERAARSQPLKAIT